MDVHFCDVETKYQIVFVTAGVYRYVQMDKNINLSEHEHRLRLASCVPFYLWGKVDYKDIDRIILNLN